MAAYEVTIFNVAHWKHRHLLVAWGLVKTLPCTFPYKPAVPTKWITYVRTATIMELTEEAIITFLLGRLCIILSKPVFLNLFFPSLFPFMTLLQSVIELFCDRNLVLSNMKREMPRKTLSPEVVETFWKPAMFTHTCFPCLKLAWASYLRSSMSDSFNITSTSAAFTTDWSTFHAGISMSSRSPTSTS